MAPLEEANRPFILLGELFEKGGWVHMADIERSSLQLPPGDLRIDEPLQALLSQADQALGRLDGAVPLVPNPDLFVLMYVRREAEKASHGTFDADLLES